MSCPLSPKRGGHLRLVPPGTLAPAPASADPPAQPPATASKRQLPPLKPRRRAAAVRKSLRVTLANAESMVALVDAADARRAAEARRAVKELQRRARHITMMADELEHAVECEIRYHLWFRGQPYEE